jgi:hypothetical protein
MRKQLTNVETLAIYRALNKQVTPHLVRIVREYGEQPAALVTAAVMLGWLSDAGFTRPDVLELIDAYFPVVAAPRLIVVGG